MNRLTPKHGGNIYRAAEKTGISAKKVMDFSASINPLGTPATAITAISRQLDLIPHYPQPFAEDLSLHIAEHFNVDPDSVICGNGSNELIYLIPRCLKPSKVLVTAPTFSEYERACIAAGARKIYRVTLKAEQNFDIDPDQFVRKMTQCDMAFLCNPNNPTGRLLENRKVLKVAHAAKECGCYLIVDEAFIDFSANDSILAEVKNNPRLIVIRSMTKFYALAGLRIGFGVVPGHLVVGLGKYREPWTVNSLAQAAARAVLSDRDYQKASIRNIEEEKQFIEMSLDKLGITWYPSSANYYLLHVPEAQTIIRALETRGILVRDCSNFYGLDNSYIRIAVRTRRENKRLIRELSAI